MKYLHIIGSLILTILTLGAYARYQANRAKFSKNRADTAERQINSSNNIIRKQNEASKHNSESMQQAINDADNRNYFDQYGDAGLSDKDISATKF